MKIAILLFLAASQIYFGLTEHSIYLEAPFTLIFLGYCIFLIFINNKESSDSTSNY